MSSPEIADLTVQGYDSDDPEGSSSGHTRSAPGR